MSAHLRWSPMCPLTSTWQGGAIPIPQRSHQHYFLLFFFFKSFYFILFFPVFQNSLFMHHTQYPTFLKLNVWTRPVTSGSILFNTSPFSNYRSRYMYHFRFTTMWERHKGEGTGCWRACPRPSPPSLTGTVSLAQILFYSVKCTWHQSLPFLGTASGAFTLLCRLPNRNSVPFKHWPRMPGPQTLPPTILLSMDKSWLLQSPHRAEIRQYLSLCAWFISLGILSSWFIYL